MEDYLKDIEDWESSFCCNCGEDTFEKFTWQRSVSNGEVWECEDCGSECLVDHQPNEDDY